jgi:ribosomal protein S18 acetylase RimI-like enzyme
VIRPAAPGDVPRIQALMRSVPGFWDETWRPNVLERVLRAPETIALVHEEAGVVDGFVCGHDVGFRAYLSELVVSATSRGRGVGSRLIAALERRLAERGCAVLIADVWRDAEPFYRSRGWSPPAVTPLRKRLDSQGTATIHRPQERPG